MFSRCAPSLSNTVLDYVILVPFLSRRYIYQLPKRPPPTFSQLRNHRLGPFTLLVYATTLALGLDTAV
jgi:hypothetical protein